MKLSRYFVSWSPNMNNEYVVYRRSDTQLMGHSTDRQAMIALADRLEHEPITD